MEAGTQESRSDEEERMEGEEVYDIQMKQEGNREGTLEQIDGKQEGNKDDKGEEEQMPVIGRTEEKGGKSTHTEGSTHKENEEERRVEKGINEDLQTAIAAFDTHTDAIFQAAGFATACTSDCKRELEKGYYVQSLSPSFLLLANQVVNLYLCH